MSGEIEIIMKITECSLEQATEAFNTFSNVEDACDYLIFLGDAPPQAKRRKLNLIFLGNKFEPALLHISH